ncbi:hypothetical protein [Citrobacter portucalensis]|nr:hypothetical protein [Citrobacter portucalensis]
MFTSHLFVLFTGWRFAYPTYINALIVGRISEAPSGVKLFG